MLQNVVCLFSVKVSYLNLLPNRFRKMEKIGSLCGLKTLQKLCNNKIKIQQDFTIVQAHDLKRAHLNVLLQACFH